MFKNTAYLLILLLGLQACSTAIKPTVEIARIEPNSQFSHQLFNEVLGEIVDSEGRVRYNALVANPKKLEAYYSQIAAFSPDSHPERFATEDARLAYWLNAYNAAVLMTVLEHYPISSVKDVKPPRVLLFLPDIAGFFVFQKPIFGGDKINLYDVENKIIRNRFDDPRIQLLWAALRSPIPHFKLSY